MQSSRFEGDECVSLLVCSFSPISQLHLLLLLARKARGTVLPDKSSLPPFLFTVSSIIVFALFTFPKR